MANEIDTIHLFSWISDQNSWTDLPQILIRELGRNTGISIFDWVYFYRRNSRQSRVYIIAISVNRTLWNRKTTLRLNLWIKNKSPKSTRHNNCVVHTDQCYLISWFLSYFEDYLLCDNINNGIFSCYTGCMCVLYKALKLVELSGS